jgi:hypothetical protein
MYRGVALQLGQVVEGVGAAQLTSVNQAHEQVAHLRPVLRPIEQRNTRGTENCSSTFARIVSLSDFA